MSAERTQDLISQDFCNVFLFNKIFQPVYVKKMTGFIWLCANIIFVCAYVVNTNIL